MKDNKDPGWSLEFKEQPLKTYSYYLVISVID